ncbi:hypothetical protein C1X05_01980 [Laceyella sacchari]|nr:hypothetical protein C1X05_01980 [Laceyella sacchari]
MMRRILPIGFITLALVVSSWGMHGSPALANPSQSDTKKKLEDVKNEAKETKASLKEVEAKLEQHKKDVSKVDEKLSAYLQQIDALNKNLAANEKEKKAVEQKLRKKLQRLYLQGENEYLAHMLAAESFADFLNRFQLIRIIVNQDMNDFHHYNDLKKKYEEDKAKVVKAKEEQEKLLKESKQRVEKMLKEMSKYKAELKELEKQEQKLMGEFSFVGGGVLGYPSSRGMTFWNYGQNRGSHIHAGVDIPRPIGTPIYAAEGGVVKSVRYDAGGYGWYIIVRHNNGLETLYAHMYSYQVKVSTGQRVARGQVIGAVGNAGRSSGPHLHFEVHKNGQAVNPKPYIS